MDQFKLKHIKNNSELVIEELSSIVGRSDNSDLQVDSNSLSREHARIVIRGNSITVQDLHSTNGTFVNERQIFEATEIKAGDVIRFGQERFSLQSNVSDATVMFDQKSLSGLADSAMMVEDEDEVDGTVMLQSISLPVGWDKSESLESDDSDLSPEDQKLVVALEAHAANKLRHKFGLVITVFPDGTAPFVKLLSSDGDAASWTIGRDASCHVHLDDSRISSHHASLGFADEKWSVKDEKSRNGIFHIGKKVDSLDISDKTNLELGPFTISLKSITRP